MQKKKAFDEVEHLFMIKTIQKVGIEGTCLNIIRAIYNKPTANNILKGEKLKAFHLRPETRQRCPFSPLFTQHSLEPVAITIREEKEIKRI